MPPLNVASCRRLWLVNRLGRLGLAQKRTIEAAEAGKAVCASSTAAEAFFDLLDVYYYRRLSEVFPRGMYVPTC